MQAARFCCRCQPCSAALTFPHTHHPAGRARPCLRRELLRDIDVKFAGYKHPHPLDVDIVLKVQSHSSERGTPAEVVNRALGRLINEVTSIRSSVRQQILQIRQREEQIGGGGGGGGGGR